VYFLLYDRIIRVYQTHLPVDDEVLSIPAEQRESAVDEISSTRAER